MQLRRGCFLGVGGGVYATTAGDRMMALFPGDSGRVARFSWSSHSQVSSEFGRRIQTGALFASFSPDPGMLQDPVFYGISAVHEKFLAASAQNFSAASADGLGWLS